jgi:hypothetical protein
MKFENSFFQIDEEFFKIFTKRWLKTNEIYVLLLNIEKLIKNGLIYITQNLSKVKPEHGKFYFIKDQNIKNFHSLNINLNNSLKNRTKLKFDGIEVCLFNKYYLKICYKLICLIINYIEIKRL